ncbi:uncharacterized protein [Paramormyrops kingsleyae]|uniref:N-alpha-acetyltransferase 30 n=1 Tax=Paramormyrops kingsleyae TaxID=1676925 RepID=A0A3B3QEX0_9TELE|nr:N-alpha-acetyltransferase 30-like [Paramormyrops kingsleyae]
MAEVPSGPSSALPASPAEMLPFAGSGFVGCVESEDRVCGRADTSAAVTRQSQTCDGKGANKTNRNHLFSLSAAVHFHTHTQPQQLNGLIGSTEDDPLVIHHNDVHSNPNTHHPAHRTPDCAGDPSMLGEGRESNVENNNFCDRNSTSQEYNSCSKSTSSHSNNNIKNMPTISRTDGRPSKLVVGDGVVRTDNLTSIDRKITEDGEEAEVRRADVESDTGNTPVLDMERLSLNSLPDRGGQGDDDIRYVRYESELQMPDIMRLITKDLSEPYSIYTYRYFIHNWPQLCFLAMVRSECVGAIVCKLDMHKKMFRRGYIAMLAVDSKYRRKSIGTNLVKNAIYAMVDGDCDEVVLETEITNKSALKLYENLGFVRDKRLFRYYLNGVDALRLKLWLR